jgi:DNA primase
MEKKVPMELPIQLGLVRRGEAGDHYDFFRDRLIFGVISAEGKVLGFSGRALDEEAQPKYLNSPESLIYHKGDSLLGMPLARQAVREADQVVLVEGNFDRLRLQQEGLNHAVAPLGTSLTEGQVRALARWTQNFVLIFDGDEAGLRAANRSLEIFLPLGLAPRVVLLPKGEDPDSFVGKNGIEPLRLLISKAPPLLDLRIDSILKGAGAEGQTRGVKRISELLALLPGEVEKRLYLQRVAQKTGLSEGLLLSGISPQKRLKKVSNFSAGPADSKKRLSPVERTLLEVLLGGEARSELLFGELQEGDFSEKEFGILWGLLKKDFTGHGALSVPRVLDAIGDQEEIRRLMTELTVGSSRWQNQGSKAAADCVRHLRANRIRGQLKDLSSEIRKAEMQQDLETMRGLLDRKSQLIRQLVQKTNELH